MKLTTLTIGLMLVAGMVSPALAAGNIFFYKVTLGGSTWPERVLVADSAEACQMALKGFLGGAFVQSIEGAGGSVEAGCR